MLPKSFFGVFILLKGLYEKKRDILATAIGEAFILDDSDLERHPMSQPASFDSKPEFIGPQLPFYQTIQLPHQTTPEHIPYVQPQPYNMQAVILVIMVHLLVMTTAALFLTVGELVWNRQREDSDVPFNWVQELIEDEDAANPLEGNAGRDGEEQ